MSTAVYELFDSSGERIYIGMTGDLRRRFREHRTKTWWPLVEEARTLTAWHPTREAAARIESALIALHRPAHNAQVNGARQPVAASVPWDTAIEAVDWDAVIDEILTEALPLDRARAAGQALADLQGWQIGMRQRRQSCVLEMRDRGMSLADIARELGLHRNRVQQIAEGRSSGGQGGKAEQGDE